MPKVKAAHANDQNQLNGLVKVIAKCGSIKKTALGTSGSFSASYRSQGTNHKRCRQQEAVKFTTKKNCLTAEKNLWLQKKSKCDGFAKLSDVLATQKNNYEIVKKAGGESIES